MVTDVSATLETLTLLIVGGTTGAPEIFVLELPVQVVGLVPLELSDISMVQLCEDSSDDPEVKLILNIPEFPAAKEPSTKVTYELVVCDPQPEPEPLFIV